jgi:hypothetical protein
MKGRKSAHINRLEESTQQYDLPAAVARWIFVSGSRMCAVWKPDFLALWKLLSEPMLCRQRMEVENGGRLERKEEAADDGCMGAWWCFVGAWWCMVGAWWVHGGCMVGAW